MVCIAMEHIQLCPTVKKNSIIRFSDFFNIILYIKNSTWFYIKQKWFRILAFLLFLSVNFASFINLFPIYLIIKDQILLYTIVKVMRINVLAHLSCQLAIGHYYFLNNYYSSSHLLFHIIGHWNLFSIQGSF